MSFELALVMVAVPASYWGVLLVRRGVAPTFAWMLTATGAAAWISYAAHRSDAPGAVDALGAVAIGAGVCLLVLGPMARRAARWAIATDRLKLAAALVEIGDLLQPGTAGPDDKASLTALRDVRSGEVDAAIDALRSARAKAPQQLHRAFDERIALLYVVAMRWADAVAHAEATLFPTNPAPLELPDGGVTKAPNDVARLLGMSPPIWVELTAAYGRLGRIDRAAEMAAEFDRAATGAPSMASLVHRVRLVFLAAAGRTAPVERLLAQRGHADIRPASRLYWSALAAERAGDRAAARTAYQAALGHARRVPRVQAQLRDALDGLDRAAPAALSPAAAQIADDLAASEVVLPPAPRRRRDWMTSSVVVANIAVAALTALLIGSPGDMGALVRVGANVPAAVDHGEPWRLASAVFVHVGWIHLLVNMIGLWSIGRMLEGLIGSARTFAIYACAGLAGAAASHLWGGRVSAGASGAIFGLLGALLVELLVAGKQYARPERRALIGALVFVTLIQLCMGLLYAAIDQTNHAVGLAAGTAAGLLFSPHGPAAKLRGYAARAVAAAAIVVFAYAGVRVALTSYGDTIARPGTAPVTLQGVALIAPATWTSDGHFLDDPDKLDFATFDHQPVTQAAAFDDLRQHARDDAKEAGFEEALAAPDTIVPLPAGWSSAELVATVDDDLGSTQRFRVVLFAHQEGAETVRGELYVPEILARDAADAYAATISSARVDPNAPPAPKVAPTPAPR
jgi:rhomboid protease GluP